MPLPITRSVGKTVDLNLIREPKKKQTLETRNIYVESKLDSTSSHIQERFKTLPFTRYWSVDSKVVVSCLITLGVSSPLIFPLHLGNSISMNALVTSPTFCGLATFSTIRVPYRCRSPRSWHHALDNGS